MDELSLFIYMEMVKNPVLFSYLLQTSVYTNDPNSTRKKHSFCPMCQW